MREHIVRQEDYLRRQYDSQPLLNQLYVLWASSQAPGLLDAPSKKVLLDKIRKLQQPDGGWRIMSLDSIERSDHSAEPAASDGYATGLVVMALDEAGVHDESVAAAVRWLKVHQHPDGTWDAWSMNKQREPNSFAGPFMSDAATGYATMALLQLQHHPVVDK